MSGRRFLTIPARVARPGDATFATPFLERPALDAPLRITSFEGTSFVDEWLAYGADPSRPLPPLVPFRDWSEPPSATLDAAGAPRWAAGQIVRGAPANPVSDEGTLGEDLDSDGVPHDDVAWLRKLYLPAHDRFNIVAAELVCRQPTLPSVTRSRVEEVGVVVRRVAFDEEGMPHYLDWVSGGEERGLWVDLTTFGLEASNTPAAGRRRLDPRALPNDALLRNLVGAKSGDTLEVRTGSGAVLAGAEGKRGATVAWAVVPLTSSEQEVFVDPGIDTLAGYADELVADVIPDFEDTASQVHAAISAPFLELVEPIIPSPPSAFDLSLARGWIDFMTGGAADSVARDLVTWFRSHLWLGAALNLSGYEDWIDDAYAGAFAAMGPYPPFGPLPETHMRTLLDAELASRWDDLTTGLAARTTLTTESTRELHTWSAIIARRVRECRVSLVEDVYDALRDVFGPEIGASLDAYDDVSASTLALELDNWIFADLNRDRVPRPWDRFDFHAPATPRHRLDFHEKAREMERIFASIRERLAPAGDALTASLDDLRPATSSFDLFAFDLETSGLAWDGELEAGLLVWPTPHLSDADLEAFVGPGGTLWDHAADPAVTDLDLVRTKSEKQLRPRFDSSHLYVAQLYARVAGTHPCDPVTIVWSAPTEPFSVAAHGDLLGIRPVAIEAPNLPKLLADIPRMARAGASPFAHVLTPDNSAYVTGDDPADTRRSFDLAMVCSFGIPVFTICAMILFQIIFQILIKIPGFVWMLLLKFCLPIPRRS